MIKKCFTPIIIALFTFQASAEEMAPSDPIKKFALEEVNLSQKKHFIYATGPICGAGASFRTRNKHRGSSWDSRIITLLPAVPSIGMATDYNLYHFFKEQRSSLYLSGGIGIAGGIIGGFPAIIPYLPLRFGRQFPKGFLDIGIQIVPRGLKRLPAPIPEARLGFAY